MCCRMFRKNVMEGELVKTIFPENENAAVGSYPQRPTAVFNDRVDLFRGNSVGAVQVEESAIPVFQKSPAVSPNPEPAIPVLMNRDDGRMHVWGVYRVEDGHLDAVKPREAVPRADPEISIVRLSDAPDAALRQAVLNVPLTHDVLGTRGRSNDRKNCQEK